MAPSSLSLLKMTIVLYRIRRRRNIAFADAKDYQKAAA
jgi:hypothetical protein